MRKRLHKWIWIYKGKPHAVELYEVTEIEKSNLIKQVQVIPFIDDNHILICKHIDGHCALPAGSIEKGGNFEQTLKREVLEECAAEVLNFGLIGYVKVLPQYQPEGIFYQLQYWAYVKLLDRPVKDPDDEVVAREVIEVGDASKRFGWRDDILLSLAVKKYKRHQDNSDGSGKEYKKCHGA